MTASAKPLAILYEHPSWFAPLFAALERRGIGYEAIQLAGHSFDPASSDPPAPLILSRVAQSGFLREPEHPIFYAAARSSGSKRSAAASSTRSRSRLAATASTFAPLTPVWRNPAATPPA